MSQTPDKMASLVDEAARILAGPTPRRQALKLLAGALAGGFLGTLGARRAKAQIAPDAFGHCPGGGVSCSYAGHTFCLSRGKTCCGDTSGCNSNQTCCTTGSRPFCANGGTTCCGNTSCNSTQKCCTTGSTAFCAPTGQSCCGSTSCTSTQKCCNNTVCCGSGQTCSNGRCVASGS